ncbi:O-antigen ligase family protein [Celerinatantimonas sp. MCCC 1A17872]|uniref:O-antigen ligase family protein n=1 Tax=Celerinatantimonas sp. MCCC 1A17872 TaxID=3177514 RepID=UPI0038C1D9E1
MKNNRCHQLAIMIILLSGFQQFPVFRVGGSLNIYELLTIFIVFLFFVGFKLTIKKYDYLVLMFFIILPILSFFLGILRLSEHTLEVYNSWFPGALKTFRYSIYIATTIPTIYYILCGFSFIAISNIKWDVIGLYRTIRWLIFISTIIAVITLITSFLNVFLSIKGPVQALPSFLQHVGDIDYGVRTSGFSQEPSFYVLYQGWIILFIYFYRKIFSRYMLLWISVINLISFILTMSSAIVSFLISCFFVCFLLSKTKGKLKIVFLITSVSLILFYLMFNSSYGNMISYIFFYKVEHLFSNPTNTLDSGSFRAYTNIIGLHIFYKFFLFGVGPGSSIFYMPLYEGVMNIKTYGETLASGSFPQSTFVSVLAELGIFGFSMMIAIFFSSFYKFFKFGRQFEIMRCFAVGTLFTFGCLVSVAPAYSMFIWIFIAFGHSVYRYLRRSEYASR